MRQDQSDFDAFYGAWRDACLRAVWAVVGDQDRAQDLVAEAFARAWASWRKVSRHPAPQSWVVRTALNHGVSLWRRRSREVPLLSHDAPACAGPESSMLDLGLMRALQRLPVRQREVIALRILLDLDTAGAAGVLGIAPGTVTAHLARAIATLRDEVVNPGKEKIDHG